MSGARWPHRCVYEQLSCTDYWGRLSQQRPPMLPSPSSTSSTTLSLVTHPIWLSTILAMIPSQSSPPNDILSIKLPVQSSTSSPSLISTCQLDDLFTKPSQPSLCKKTIISREMFLSDCLTMGLQGLLSIRPILDCDDTLITSTATLFEGGFLGVTLSVGIGRHRASDAADVCGAEQWRQQQQ